MRPNLAVQAFLTLLVGVIVGTVGLPAWADQGGIPAQIAALQQDVQTLQQQVKRLIDQAKTQSTTTGQLTAIVNSQSQLIGLLQQQNQDLQAKLGCMSKTGNEVYFTGCNLHILSGSGSTNGEVNGLGNVIIGYNEDAARPGRFYPSQKGGSHNLVIGSGHSYSSYGGLVAGFENAIMGPNANVTGGRLNLASGSYSTVSGGEANIASGENSSVSGGSRHLASGIDSSISGGARHVASGYQSSVCGGNQNTASGSFSSVSGGSLNTAIGFASSLSGGQGRTAPNDYNWAAGGLLESQ